MIFRSQMPTWKKKIKLELAESWKVDKKLKAQQVTTYELWVKTFLPSSPKVTVAAFLACVRVGGRGVGGEHGVPWKATEMWLLTFYLELVTRVQQVLCCNSDTPPQFYPDQDPDTMLSCFACWTSKLYTLSATKPPLAHSKQERKKERKNKKTESTSLSACQLHTPPPTWLCLLEECIITFLFPSSENEGFSQEFQSLGAQANSWCKCHTNNVFSVQVDANVILTMPLSVQADANVILTMS